MGRTKKIENMFNPARTSKATPKGAAGYDNPRENVDPHIKTKVVNSKEGTFQSIDVGTDGRIVDYTGIPAYITYGLKSGGATIAGSLLLCTTVGTFICAPTGTTVTIYAGSSSAADFSQTLIRIKKVLSMGGNKITNLGAPTLLGDATTKNYVDGLTSDLRDDSMADALHRHSELSASDGTPDAVLTMSATGLELRYFASSQPVFKIESTGTSSAILDFKNTNDEWQIYLATTTGDLRFWNGADKVTFEAGGNVGIGTSSPTTKFSVLEKSGMTPIGGFAIKLTNKTGGNTVAGQLVDVYSATAVDDAFATAGASSDGVIGIVLDAGVADGSKAWVVVSGIADVLMDAGGSARGDRLISSATAGSADVWNTGGAVATHFQEIGHCIETRTGAGLARAVLHFN